MANILQSPSFQKYTCLGLGAVSFSIGLGPFTAPDFSAKYYGLAAKRASEFGYQQALGVRDMALGVAYVITYLRGDLSAVETLLIAQGTIGFGDALVVWLNRGDQSCLPTHLSAGCIAIGLGLALQWSRGEDTGKDDKRTSKRSQVRQPRKRR